MKYHSRIPGILDTRFVKYDEVAHALATGLASGKNVLLHGPGGHAKSEMVEAILRGLDLWDAVFLESFGEGLTEDTLWGGINLDAMNRTSGARIEFQPEYSFLNSEIAVFEEMLDAPSPVLLALKDTLTRKELRKGAQRFPMRTRVVIACTNHDPETYADSDDPADRARVALLERFPIQVTVKWDSYNAADYLSMFQKHPLYSIVNGNAEKLAEILSEATSQGHFVSPRTAIHALEIIYSNSLDRGHTSIQPADIADIKCLAGLGTFGENLVEDIAQLSRMADARAALKDISVEFGTLRSSYDSLEDSAVKHIQTAKRANALKLRVLDVKVPEDLKSERQELANVIDTFAETAQQRGIELVRA
jgi:hypothetical protein